MAGSVLVVDSDASSLSATQALLEQRGIDVVTAGSAAEARRIVLESGPAVLILDTDLDGVDGFAFCRALIAEAGAAPPPVLLTSRNLRGKQAHLRAKEAGARLLLERPEQDQVLVAAVMRLLEPPAPATPLAVPTHAGLTAAGARRRTSSGGGGTAVMEPAVDLCELDEEAVGSWIDEAFDFAGGGAAAERAREHASAAAPRARVPAGPAPAPELTPSAPQPAPAGRAPAAATPPGAVPRPPAAGAPAVPPARPPARSRRLNAPAAVDRPVPAPPATGPATGPRRVADVTTGGRPVPTGPSVALRAPEKPSRAPLFIGLGGALAVLAAVGLVMMRGAGSHAAAPEIVPPEPSAGAAPAEGAAVESPPATTEAANPATAGTEDEGVTGGKEPGAPDPSAAAVPSGPPSTPPPERPAPAPAERVETTSPAPARTVPEASREKAPHRAAARNRPAEGTPQPAPARTVPAARRPEPAPKPVQPLPKKTVAASPPAEKPAEPPATRTISASPATRPAAGNEAESTPPSPSPRAAVAPGAGAPAGEARPIEQDRPPAGDVEATPPPAEPLAPALFPETPTGSPEERAGASTTGESGAAAQPAIGEQPEAGAAAATAGASPAEKPEEKPEDPPLRPLIAQDAISPPELIPESRVVPVFPRIARRQGVTGTVELSALIGVDGRVSEVEVLKEPARAFGFGKAAVAAVKQWRYRPARRGNKPVAERITIRIVFK